MNDDNDSLLASWFTSCYGMTYMLLLLIIHSATYSIELCLQLVWQCAPVHIASSTKTKHSGNAYVCLSKRQPVGCSYSPRGGNMYNCVTIKAKFLTAIPEFVTLFKVVSLRLCPFSAAVWTSTDPVQIEHAKLWIEKSHLLIFEQNTTKLGHSIYSGPLRPSAPCLLVYFADSDVCCLKCILVRINNGIFMLTLTYHLL